AVTLNNLAAVEEAKGDLARSTRHYRRALVIKERLLGPRHRDVAITLNNLAGILRTRRQPVEAARMYRRALNILERPLAPRHPKIARCRANYLALIAEMHPDTTSP